MKTKATTNATKLSAEIDKAEGVLVVRIPLAPMGEISKSGKSRTVATTRGNQVVDAGGELITIGVNAYQPR